jgi:arsenate reductase
MKLKQLLVSSTTIKSVLSAKSINPSFYAHILLVAALLLSVEANVEGQRAAKTRKATGPMPTIVFVCEHGAAKSVIAAAYFNKLASERGLSVRAISRGTNPDKDLAPKAVEGLKADGLTVGREQPKRLSEADVSQSIRVIAFCELPEAYRGRRVEQWNDVIPSVSEDYNRARDAIVERVNHLVDQMKSEK